MNELDLLAVNYQPSQAGVDVVRNARITLITGTTSAGKDTLQGELKNSFDYHSIVTHTTRQPRVNNGVLERDGIDYHFVSPQQMMQMLVSHEMIEVNRFGSNYYGTSVKEFQEANSLGKIALSNIDVNGVSSFIKISPNSITPVFIVPPDYSTWLRRVKGRYDKMGSFDEDWEVRRELAIKELEFGLSAPYFYFVINSNLQYAAHLIDEIAHRETPVAGFDDSEARRCAKEFLEAIRQPDAPGTR